MNHRSSALRRGLLSAQHAQVMAEWERGGGFSVDAKVRIEAHERDGLERLLRYCARPVFALERLREIDPEHLVYESVKPGSGGNIAFIDLGDGEASIPSPNTGRWINHIALEVGSLDELRAIKDKLAAEGVESVAPWITISFNRSTGSIRMAFVLSSPCAQRRAAIRFTSTAKQVPPMKNYRHGRMSPPASGTAI